MPISTNVATPAATSAAGAATRRGAASTAMPKPTIAAITTGSFTRLAKKSGMAVGISESGSWRPRSSAELLV